MSGVTLAQQRGVVRVVRTAADLARSVGRADEASQLEASLAGLSSPVTIAVVGEAGSGRTTLATALVGLPPLGPSVGTETGSETGSGPADAPRTLVLRYAAEPAASATPSPDADPTATATAQVGVAVEPPTVERAVVEHRDRRWSDTVLVDLGAVPLRSDVVRFDLFVWCHRGDQPLRLAELDAIREIAALRPVLVALTLADVVPDVAVVAAEVELALRAARLAVPVCAVSAQLAALVADLPEVVREQAAAIAGIATLAERLRQQVRSRIVPGRFLAVLGLAGEACVRIIAATGGGTDPTAQRRTAIEAEIARLEPMAARVNESARTIDQMVADAITIPRARAEDEFRVLRHNLENLLLAQKIPTEEELLDAITQGAHRAAATALAVQDAVLTAMAEEIIERFGVRDLGVAQPSAEVGKLDLRLPPSGAAPAQGWVPVVLQSAGIGGLVMSIGGAVAGAGAGGAAAAGAAAAVVSGPVGWVAGAVVLGVAVFSRRRLKATAGVMARRDLTGRLREACAEGQRQTVRALAARQDAVARQWRLGGAAEALVRRTRELRQQRDQLIATPDPAAASPATSAEALLSRIREASASLRDVGSTGGQVH